ncbi:hypothetical protein BCR44DRAFT_44495 [Catenaria anguillulae PL171]|uniref:Uncharacterized protein n=1 Tax=Catenaria anguillulae PL171 TaxID=765915 RepID=A0A1Y2I3F5_9FUNG|nr:hypothetical protein BCR44DRAFT_44495 [Catenaria anguillulae PL171]
MTNDPQQAQEQQRLAHDTLQYYRGFLAADVAIHAHVPSSRLAWLDQTAIDMSKGNAVLPAAVASADVSLCRAQVFLTHSQGLLAVLVEFLANGFKILDIVPCCPATTAAPADHVDLDHDLNARFRAKTFDTFESMLDQVGGAAHRNQFASLLSSRLAALSSTGQ